jgi:SAM-dependent methyltransferase
MFFVERWQDVLALFEAHELGRNLLETWVSAQPELPAYCCVCRAITNHRIGGPSQSWINLRGSCVCAQCGLPGRMRSLVQAIDQTIPRALVNSGLIFERVTRLYTELATRYPGLIGCEFLSPDFKGGSEHIIEATRRHLGDVPVRHEDMQALSFANESLDFIVHADVLEHLPRPSDAISECHRVLRPTGVMLFTCPIYARVETQKVAEMVDDEIRFLGEPAYHGNPLSEHGVPVFNNFGFELFDQVRACGFTKVEVGFTADTSAAYYSDANPWRSALMWHILCRASK